MATPPQLYGPSASGCLFSIATSEAVAERSRTLWCGVLPYTQTRVCAGLSGSMGTRTAASPPEATAAEISSGQVNAAAAGVDAETNVGIDTPGDDEIPRKFAMLGDETDAGVEARGVPVAQLPSKAAQSTATATTGTPTLPVPVPRKCNTFMTYRLARNVGQAASETVAGTLKFPYTERRSGGRGHHHHRLEASTTPPFTRWSGPASSGRTAFQGPR